MNKLLYVAGPYKGDIENNIARAEQVSINLIRNGFHVFTPHKNTAGYEKYENEAITYKTWITMDLDILERCDALYVMKNSEKSVGTQKEIKCANDNEILVIFESGYPSLAFTMEKYRDILKEREVFKEGGLEFINIRKAYGVPAKNGGRIKYMGYYGIIVGTERGYLMIKLDGEKEVKSYHPTWEIEYL